LLDPEPTEDASRCEPTESDEVKIDASRHESTESEEAKISRGEQGAAAGTPAVGESSTA